MRAERTDATLEVDHRPWWLRVRSAVLLALLLAAIGIAAAASIGIAVVTLTTLLDQALA